MRTQTAAITPDRHFRVLCKNTIPPACSGRERAAHVVQNAVCAAFSVPLRELRNSKAKSTATTRARRVTCYLLRTKYGWTFRDIGETVYSGSGSYVSAFRAVAIISAELDRSAAPAADITSARALLAIAVP
jgi:chromosomal replication initiation ATPase DnaA